MIIVYPKGNSLHFSLHIVYTEKHNQTKKGGKAGVYKTSARAGELPLADEVEEVSKIRRMSSRFSLSGILPTNPMGNCGDRGAVKGVFQQIRLAEKTDSYRCQLPQAVLYPVNTV